MHASRFAPATPLTEEGGASSPDDAASSAQCREILVQIPEEMTRLGFVEALWQLKAQGQVKAWRWECDFLSLTIVRDALREHACLEAARLPKLGGSRLGCKCLDDADSLGAGTWQQRITSLVRWTLRQGWALGSELAEPGTDFDFLTVADEAGARVAAACPADTALMRHAQQEQKRQAQAAAQHSALYAGAAPHVSQMLAAERREVERLEHLLRLHDYVEKTQPQAGGAAEPRASVAHASIAHLLANGTGVPANGGMTNGSLTNGLVRAHHPETPAGSGAKRAPGAPETSAHSSTCSLQSDCCPTLVVDRSARPPSAVDISAFLARNF